MKSFKIGMVLAALVGLLAWNSFAAETAVITVKSGTGTKTVMTATSNNVTCLVPFSVSNMTVNLTNVNVSTITATGAITGLSARVGAALSASNLTVDTSGAFGSLGVTGLGTFGTVTTLNQRVNGTITASNLTVGIGGSVTVTNLGPGYTNYTTFTGGIFTGNTTSP